jgi:hypothetical protein
MALVIRAVLGAIFAVHAFPPGVYEQDLDSWARRRSWGGVVI